jgi:hypothetical protein
VTAPGVRPAPLTLRPTGGRTDANGRFRVVNVTPGRYAIHARLTASQLGGSTTDETPFARSRTIRVWAMEEIEATGANIDGLVLRLQPAMTMPGRVALDSAGPGSASAELTAIRVRLTTLPGDLAVPMSSSQPTAVGEDGRFVVEGILPGAYRLTATAPGSDDEWWLRSAVSGGRDLLDAPVVFGPAGGPANVVLTFTTGHTELSGVFTGPDGTPAPSFVIVALPADRSLWQPFSRRVVATRPATDGRYAFRDLPPGGYLVAALTDLDLDDLQDVAFLEQLAQAGVPVSLGEGDRTVQDLRIAQ